MIKFKYQRDSTLWGNIQKDINFALSQEVYGPLGNLSQKQWAQIEQGVKALMKEYGPNIPIEPLRAIKLSHERVISRNNLVQKS